MNHPPRPDRPDPARPPPAAGTGPERRLEAELEATREELASAHEEFDVAPVVLDAALRIQRFTPAATRLFHLLPADAGRALADLTPQFHDPRLLDDARAVLREAPPSGSEGRRRRRFLVGAPHLALPHPG